jgi:hypothetical protein
MKVPELPTRKRRRGGRITSVNSTLTRLLHIPHGRDSEDALAFDLNLDIIAVVYK